MSPVWHALTIFVPIYNLFRIHAHFRTINEQSVLRALPRRMPAGIAVAGIFVVALLWRGARQISDGATWITVVGAADLLLAAIMATGQSALNRVWEHDFRAASERKPARGELTALIILSIGVAVIFYSWERTGLADLKFPSPWGSISLSDLRIRPSWGFDETFDRTTSVPKADPSVVVRTATDDGLVMTIPASADLIEYLIYRDDPTQGRNFAFRVDVGPTTGRGAIMLALTTPNEDDEWTVFVDPVMDQWWINESHSGMEYAEIRVEPVTYPSSGPLRTIELRVTQGSLSVFVNGKDVSAGHTRAMSQLPSDLIVGYGTQLDSQARHDDPFTVTFKGVSLREIK
jgi:hypothetical protein